MVKIQAKPSKRSQASSTEEIISLEQKRHLFVYLGYENVLVRC